MATKSHVHCDKCSKIIKRRGNYCLECEKEDIKTNIFFGKFFGYSSLISVIISITIMLTIGVLLQEGIINPLVYGFELCFPYFSWCILSIAILTPNIAYVERKKERLKELKRK